MFKKLIQEYEPKNEQEAIDKAAIIAFISTNDDYLLRDNLIAHVTSSAIIVNEDYTKTLFAFHLIYQSWAWLGGHNDGDENCLNVAIKEAKEESGLKNITVVLDKPIMIDNINVSNHYKKGKYVPDHVHLNVTYLLQANEHESLMIKSDENSGVKWINIDDIYSYVNEERMIPRYNKAFAIVKKIREDISF